MLEKAVIWGVRIDIIEPGIEQLRQQGIQLHGPYPADTLFQPKYLKS